MLQEEYKEGNIPPVVAEKSLTSAQENCEQIKLFKVTNPTDTSFGDKFDEENSSPVISAYSRDVMSNFYGLSKLKDGSVKSSETKGDAGFTNTRPNSIGFLSSNNSDSGINPTRNKGLKRQTSGFSSFR